MPKLEGEKQFEMHIREHELLLEKRKKWELMGIRGVLIFFIVLTEVVPYFQHSRMLDLWHSFSPIIRISSYVGLLLLQYLLNKRISERKLGVHLAHLKELVREMQYKKCARYEVSVRLTTSCYYQKKIFDLLMIDR